MTYEEFKQAQDIKFEKMRVNMQKKANAAYNEGLWNAVKWNPFKWWMFFVLKRSA